MPRKPSFAGNLSALLVLASMPILASQAQAQAPGSDPVALTNAVSYLAFPTAVPAPSQPLDATIGLPAWLQAKVLRYEAKAFSYLEGGDGTVYTERDVVSRQTGNALERTCTTSVASNTVTPAVGPDNRYGPGVSGDQIAILRGDVVTICK